MEKCFMFINQRNTLFKTVNSQINLYIQSNSNKNINSIFTELDTLIVWKTKELRTSKADVKNIIITSSDTKTYTALQQ